jgi:hypothetical protein
MSLVLRRDKGSKLSSNEMDDNLLELSRILSASDGTGVIQVTGSSFDASNTPITSSFFTGDGSALTNITASYLPGIDGSQLLNVTASYISPSISIPVNGNNTQIQFNSSSALSGSDYLVYNYDSQSLAHGNNNHDTIGLYSHAEGSTNTTLGEYSHAEGSSTYTGVYGYYIDLVTFSGTNTEITLNNSYGNITGDINSAGYLLIRNNNGIFYEYDTYSSTWDGSNTIITIFNIDLTSVFTLNNIIFLSYFNSTYLLFQPTNADATSYSNYAHAEGWQTFALGNNSHAEGRRTIAAGLASHAEGYLTKTFNDYSHTEGWATIASGAYSHAEGRSTIASGLASHAEGYGTEALGNYQLVIGQYNESSLSQSAFIIGDGTTEIDRHNVLFVSKSYFEVSASNMYLQGLANSSQTYVVAIDTATGQLSYTLASGVGSLTPAGGNDTSIQFNSASAFSGSDNFTYDYTTDIIKLTGSMFVSGTISASFGPNTIGFFGTSSWAESASQVVSSSYALSSSNALTASSALTASYITGSVFTNTNPALSASYALSSSFSIRTSYVTGSIFTNLNPALTASHALTASVVITALTASYVTGSVFTSTNPALSASYALTASFVATASYVTGSIFTSTNQALTSSHALTASFVRTAQTASYVTGSIFTSTNPALSASYALTASFVSTASYISSVRASSASAAGFSLIGGDYGIVITLSPQFPNNNYAVTVTGEDPRSWTVESKTNTQFTIQSNSSVALTGPVYWIAIPFNN